MVPMYNVVNGYKIFLVFGGTGQAMTLFPQNTQLIFCCSSYIPLLRHKLLKYYYECFFPEMNILVLQCGSGKKHLLFNLHFTKK
jgi:hypothetical protein